MKCFYHNDIDGRCAGAIVARFTNNYNKQDFIEYKYDGPIPTELITEGEDVYFVDLSFSANSKDKLDEILHEKHCNLVWCDHHDSSMNLIMDHPEYAEIPGIRKIGISGAALTWMYFYGCPFEKIPRFVQLVSDFDCWIFSYGSTTLWFKYGIESQNYGVMSPLWNALVRDEINDNREYLSKLVENGEIISKYVKREYKEYLKRYGYVTELDGNACLVVNRSANSLIFGDKINDYPLVALWAYDGKQYKYSIYTESDAIDCAKIAEKYGGGGHKKAAGFVSNELIFKKQEGEIYYED